MLACSPTSGGTETADTAGPGPSAPASTTDDSTTGMGTTDTDPPTGSTTATSSPPAPGEAALADIVLDAPGAGTGLFRDPELAINGVRGEGQSSGSLDVYSIGLEPGDDTLVLGWSSGVVFDVEGPDLIVFENPFNIGDTTRFMDPAVVEVSPDGVTFVAFPSAYGAPDPTSYSSDPSHWVGFAGVTPVTLHTEDFPVDPFGPAAGGDAFDLADLPQDDPTATRVLLEGVRAVRITSASLHTDPNTGAPYVRDPVSNGPDIDGVWARSLMPD